MKKQIIQILLLAFVAAFLMHCNRNVNETVIALPGDPFVNTMVPVQNFVVDSKQDNVVEAENGATIVFPKGCFKTSDGEVVTEEVKIEIAEAISLDEMILSNLTTTSDGKLLETDGMIYFNATTQAGEQLFINKDIPVHITIRTPEIKPGMMAYKGVRDENGNMNWIEPKELDKYLITVNIDSLDFLPYGFRETVDKGMPFRKYKTSTQQLADSLYYALSFSDSKELNLTPTKVNESYYDKNKGDRNYSDEIRTEDSPPKNCGIDPAIIRAIKSEKFQNTLIATHEFESRLQAIFQSCDNSILEVYIRNLDKNLYELDSMAAALCEEKGLHNCFHTLDDFSKQRLTKVKDSEPSVKLLRQHYEKELAKVKAELKKQKDKAMKSLQQKNEEAEKIVNAYKKLLWKREKYRMNTYGFTWTDTGWINIDNGTLPKSWASKPLEIIIENGKEFDRVHSYVIYSSIRSLYRLNTDDNVNFYVGNNELKEMLMPKQDPAVAIAIGYKGDVPSLAIKIFGTDSTSRITMTLSASTPEMVKETLAKYDNYSKENRITHDLKYMEKLYHEEQRQKQLLKEEEFLIQLLRVAYPCCPIKEEKNVE
ncbi:MAG TPA: hypothetical protein VGK59_14095 [Ohtaekwangia sp.]